jgi:hypothetical protein
LIVIENKLYPYPTISNGIDLNYEERLNHIFLIINNNKMKTLKRVSPLMIVAAILFLASGCAKESPNSTKSSQLTVDLSTFKSAASNSAVTKGTATSAFTLNSAKISISDLIIEENSGNDVEQQGDHNDGGNDAENNTDNEAGGENGDVLLPGPYILDVVNGSLSIDQVAVYPGTFKKVDFSFNVSNEAGFGGNSIVVTGSYQKSDGTVLPFTLRSDFSQQVQLPIAGGGIILAVNSNITITIVLDIQSWINNIDLPGAILTNNEIIIDKTVNADLLNLFEANLALSIEVED